MKENNNLQYFTGKIKARLHFKTKSNTILKLWVENLKTKAFFDNKSCIIIRSLIEILQRLPSKRKCECIKICFNLQCINKLWPLFQLLTP